IAHITLDGLLTRNIKVDKKHPLKVFIQPEGECNGVFVFNKTPDGFDVKELLGGKSNIPFTWQIIASRADVTDNTGKVLSAYADLRFPIGPDRQPVKTIEQLPAQPVNTLTIPVRTGDTQPPVVYPSPVKPIQPPVIFNPPSRNTGIKTIPSFQSAKP
ncbi:MAG: hypothetical protein JST39_09315, partial [Bacteroidetes bacterium]|nr:hypothetical protein [Bacteroidota bacterium]